MPDLIRVEISDLESQALLLQIDSIFMVRFEVAYIY
jgi:hypothetical protein